MISVIMPAYNVANYIEKSINSVLQQSYTDFELLVINDGSTDNTREIVLDCQARDKRIRLVDQTNQGVSAARNTGIENAQGEYISFLDGDDLWHQDFLQEMVSFVKNSSQNIEFAYAKTLECFEDGRREIIGGARIVDGYFENFIAPNNELRLTFHISAMLIKRQLVMDNDIRFVRGLRLSEDTGFIISTMCVAKAYGLDKPLTYYIRRDGSATKAKKWEPSFWVGHTRIYEEIEHFVAEHRPRAMVAFTKARGYVAYRFVLSCLKHGYLDEATQYRYRWRNWLVDFANGDGKSKDRWKCKLILHAGKGILSLIGRF